MTGKINARCSTYLKKKKKKKKEKRQHGTNGLVFTYIIIIDRFYIALFSALEQTHCARM